MQKNFDENDLGSIEYLVGSQVILYGMKSVKVLPMFSKLVVDFLAALSKKLLGYKESKNLVDVVSYAYWIRKASLQKETEKYVDVKDRVGRGTAFHIAPSNVPVNFAVSMTSALLAGNACVIRVSDKKFEQVDIICRAIKELLQENFDAMRPYLCIVRYPHSQEITQIISSMCDLRIIWGGDRTIADIRRAILPPRAIEMTFADRYSLALIDADAYLQGDAEEIAKGFYTDTFYTDQNACSSPRMVIWFGQNVDQARERFWNSLYEQVDRRYEFQPIVAVDKFTTFCAAAMGDTCYHIIPGRDNRIVRVELDTLPDDLMQHKAGGGYFFEYKAKSLDEIVPLMKKQCQTISEYGMDREEIKKIVIENGVRGVDRIVPLGQTMGLEFVWDGFMMIEAMSRVIGVY